METIFGEDPSSLLIYVMADGDRVLGMYPLDVDSVVVLDKIKGNIVMYDLRFCRCFEELLSIEFERASACDLLG